MARAVQWQQKASKPGGSDRFEVAVSGEKYAFVDVFGINVLGFILMVMVHAVYGRLAFLFVLLLFRCHFRGCFEGPRLWGVLFGWR